MSLKGLVTSLLQYYNDKDPSVFNIIEMYKKQIKHDVISAFELSQPLIDIHPDIFKSSSSFINFLFTLNEIPIKKINTSSNNVKGNENTLNKETSEEHESKLTIKLEQIKKEISNLESKKVDLEKENSNLSLKNEDFNKKIKDYNETIEKNKKIQKENEDYIEKIADIQNEMKGIKEENEHLKNEQTTNSDKIKEIELQKQDLYSQNQNYKTQLTELKENHKTQLTELKENHKTQLTELKEKHDKLNTQHIEMVAENSKHKAHLELCEKLLQRYEINFETEKNNMNYTQAIQHSFPTNESNNQNVPFPITNQPCLLPSSETLPLPSSSTLLALQNKSSENYFEDNEKYFKEKLDKCETEKNECLTQKNKLKIELTKLEHKLEVVGDLDIKNILNHLEDLIKISVPLSVPLNIKYVKDTSFYINSMLQIKEKLIEPKHDMESETDICLIEESNLPQIKYPSEDEKKLEAEITTLNEKITDYKTNYVHRNNLEDINLKYQNCLEELNKYKNHNNYVHKDELQKINLEYQNELQNINLEYQKRLEEINKYKNYKSPEEYENLNKKIIDFEANYVHRNNLEKIDSEYQKCLEEIKKYNTQYTSLEAYNRLQNEFDGYKIEYTTLKQDYQSKITELETLKHSKNVAPEILNRNTELEQQSQNLLTSNNNLNKQIGELNGNVHALQKELKTVKLQYTELTQKLTQLQQNLEAVNNKNTDLMQNITTINSEKIINERKYNTYVTEKETEINQLMEDLKSKQNVIDTLNKKIEELTERYDNLHSNEEKLQQQFIQIQIEKSEMEKQTLKNEERYKEMLKEQKQMDVDLRACLAKQQDLEDKKNNQDETLNNCSSENTELKGEREQLKNTIEKLQSEKQMLENKNEMLELHLKTCQEEKLSIEANFTVCQEEIKSLKEENKTLINIVDGETAIKAQAIQNLIRRKKALEANIENLRTTNQDVTGQNANLRIQQQALLEEIERLRTSIRTVTGEIEDLRAQQQQLSEDNERLRVDNEIRIHEHANVGAKLVLYSDTETALKKQNDELERKIKKYQSEIESLNKTIREMKNKSLSKRKTKHTGPSTSQMATSQMGPSTSQMVTSQMGPSTSQMATSRMETDDPLTLENENLHKIVSDLKEEKGSLENKLMELEKKMETLQENAVENETLKEANKKFEQKINELESTITNKDEEIKTFKREKDFLNKTVKESHELTRHNDEIKTQNETLLKENENLKEIQKAQTTKLDEFYTTIQNIKTEKKLQKEYIIEKDTTIETLKNETKTLEQQNKDIQIKLDTQIKNNEENEKIIATLKTENETLTTENKSLKTENVEYKKLNDEHKEKINLLNKSLDESEEICNDANKTNDQNKKELAVLREQANVKRKRIRLENKNDTDYNEDLNFKRKINRENEEYSFQEPLVPKDVYFENDYDDDKMGDDDDYRNVVKYARTLEDEEQEMESFPSNLDSVGQVKDVDGALQACIKEKEDLIKRVFSLETQLNAYKSKQTGYHGPSDKNTIKLNDTNFKLLFIAFFEYHFKQLSHLEQINLQESDKALLDDLKNLLMDLLKEDKDSYNTVIHLYITKQISTLTDTQVPEHLENIGTIGDLLNYTFIKTQTFIKHLKIEEEFKKYFSEIFKDYTHEFEFLMIDIKQIFTFLKNIFYVTDVQKIREKLENISQIIPMIQENIYLLDKPINNYDIIPYLLELWNLQLINLKSQIT